MYRGIQNRNSEIIKLRTSVEQLEASMKFLKESQTSMENLVKGQKEILEKIYSKETAAEKHFTERVVEHKEIVKEYTDRPEDPEVSKRYWDSEQELWDDISRGGGL